MNKHISTLLSSVILAHLLLAFVHLPAGATNKPLVVVVGAATPLRNISLGELRRAFLGEAVEAGTGKRLVPINHPSGTPTRDRFDLAVLGLKPEAVGRFWVDRRIRDQSPPPKTVQSAELAIRVVASLPGAITYGTSELVNDQLRAVTIDGKAAGQPGYPLTK